MSKQTSVRLDIRLSTMCVVAFPVVSFHLFFPSFSLSVFVSPGLMTVEERRQLEQLPSPHNKFWVPCMWFVSLALRARTEGRINNDVALSAILNVRLTAIRV